MAGFREGAEGSVFKRRREEGVGDRRLEGVSRGVEEGVTGEREEGFESINDFAKGESEKRGKEGDERRDASGSIEWWTLRR